jgi:uncharacterized protein YndB with AHSA1/START domain
MSRQSYTTTFTVDRTPQEVYAAAVDPRAWWSRTITGVTDRVGEDFVFEVEGIHYSKIRVVELVPGERIVWRVLDARLTFIADETEWNDTEIRFEITEHDGRTELRFTHVGLEPEVECYGACSNAWTFYIGSSLCGLLADGVGAPNSQPDEVRLLEERAAS